LSVRKARAPIVPVNCGVKSNESSPKAAVSSSVRSCSVSQIVSGNPVTS